MSERTHEQNVKSVNASDEYLCIELLNGLRLTGPLRTKPVYRDPVNQPQPKTKAVAHQEAVSAT